MTIKAEVLRVFPRFTERLEGRIPHMYLDVKGLVTVGAGVLVPTERAAITIFKDNFPHMARKDFALLRERAPEQVRRHTEGRAWTAAQQAPWTSARLTDAELDTLTLNRLASMYIDCFGRLDADADAFDEAPATAQLAALSMMWALGSGFLRGGRWPKFRDAFRAGSWMTCANECRMRDEANAGVFPRNTANRLLFTATGFCDTWAVTMHALTQQIPAFKGFEL
jgi:hypothetical protein